MSMIKIGSDGRPLGAPTLAAFLDKKNGLMWSAEDIGGEDGLTFDKAVEACKNYRGAGFDDWRLPTIDELETLRDRTRYDPAANPDLGLASTWYWSSTPAAASPADCAWFVHFYDGYSGWDNRHDRSRVRAVRSVSRASQ
jgi:hypothetical protein